MVRLEAIDWVQENPAYAIFQFQNGTIRRMKAFEEHFHECNFNSKMVRLEATHERRNHYAHRYFNSKMVRLEAYSPFPQ